MGRPQDCASLLKQGLSPSKIAIALEPRISTNSVKQYLYVAVGMGLIRRSDILLSLDPDARSLIDEAIEVTGTDSPASIERRARETGYHLDRAEMEMYLSLRRDRAFVGDLYVFITDLEKSLHSLLRDILVRKFGEGEKGWWRNGVPEKVRLACVAARESDADNPSDPYSYTTFIHLREILDRNWNTLKTHVPQLLESDKPALMRDMDRLNAIRNKVMHPVRESPPTEEDFAFVKTMCTALARENWRLLPTPDLMAKS